MVAPLRLQGVTSFIKTKNQLRRKRGSPLGKHVLKADKRPAPFPPQSLMAGPWLPRWVPAQEPARAVPGLCGEAGPGSPLTAPGANGAQTAAPADPGVRRLRGAGPGAALAALPGGPGARIPAGSGPGASPSPGGAHLVLHRCRSRRAFPAVLRVPAVRAGGGRSQHRPALRSTPDGPPAPPARPPRRGLALLHLAVCYLAVCCLSFLYLSTCTQGKARSCCKRYSSSAKVY